MSSFLLIALILGFTNYSWASYCVCNQGLSDTILQANIDYACGTKADCSAILQTGSCYQPNSVKAHCDYAVNSYYQKMNQVTGSCNFTGSATVTSILTTTVASGCTYPASPSSVIASTPTSSTTNTNTNTSTPTTTTGSTTFASGPIGSDFSGCDINVNAKSTSLTLISLFLLGLLALCS